MKTIRTIELSGSTWQERLPGFAEDFPYIASWAETGQYNGGMVPWHWHPAVEVHISDVDAREPFRQVSYAGMYCEKTVKGQGLHGYAVAMRYLWEKYHH